MNTGVGNANTALTGATTALPDGTSLQNGAFIVRNVLGRGGYGITYRAEDTSLQRAVAIKEFFPPGSTRQGLEVLPPYTMAKEQFAAGRQSFGREASTLARFSDAGIVRIFRVFQENETVYMVMEFLEGQTLGQKLTAGALLVGEAIEISLHVSEALGIVHNAQLLHRDIKPDNIFLTDKRAVLIDFGIAREYSNAPRAMTALVTPGYAPLEQYSGQGKFGPYTDVYGLGATLYHALTGQPPTPPPDRLGGMELASPEQLNPGVSPSVGRAVMHALQIQPAARPQTMREFADELRQAYAAAAVTPSPQPRPAPKPRTSAVPRSPSLPRTPPLPRPPTTSLTLPAVTIPVGDAHAPTVAVNAPPGMPPSTPAPVAGTKICPHCHAAMPTAMLHCPHCGRNKSGSRADELMTFNEWHHNEDTRVMIGWGIAALLCLILIGGLVYTFRLAGLKPQAIKSEDIHATHARSVDDANNFKSRSAFDASGSCLKDTGPNYPCSNDGNYMTAINMVSGSDTLEITLNDDWKALSYDMRLDYARTMMRRWDKIHAPLRGKIRLLDRDGNEIGASTFADDMWVSQ